MRNELKMWGESDDIVRLTIRENNVITFDDELSCDQRLNVNDDMIVELKHHDTEGWKLSISNFEDDFNLSEFYRIQIFSSPRGYSPILYMEVNKELIIEGVYGGKKTTLKNILQDIIDDVDSEQVDMIYDRLIKHKLISE